jgi:hypothetical protein
VALKNADVFVELIVFKLYLIEQVGLRPFVGDDLLQNPNHLENILLNLSGEDCRIEINCEIEDQFSFDYLFLDVPSYLDFTLLVVFILLRQAMVPLPKIIDNLEALSHPISVSNQLEDTNGAIHFDTWIRRLLYEKMHDFVIPCLFLLLQIAYLAIRNIMEVDCFEV